MPFYADPTEKPRKTANQVVLDRDVLDLARERTAELLDRFDHVFVAFSGGKDSTAVLNVALEVANSTPRFRRHLPLRVMHQDEEAIPIETEEYVRRISQRDDVRLEWLCLPLKHRNACSRHSPWWWPWAPEDRDKWCRPLPPEAITEWPGFPIWPASARLTAPDLNGLLAPPSLGNVCMLMGIRAQESLIRRRNVTMVGRELNYLVKFTDGAAKTGNFWKGYPIYDWQHEDVWRAPAVLGWDYNRAYDRMEMAGVPISTQRCSPAFGEEPLQKLHTYAACFPEVWDKMVDRVPGVGAAVRYALTELWAYKSRPDKPEGMPWPEFVNHYLAKFAPEHRYEVATTLKKWLQAHYRGTSHPIVELAPHPKSGLSWDFILMVAMRGDFKGRKQPLGRLVSDDYTRHWARYAGELQTILDEGRFPELGAPTPPPARAIDLVPAEHRQEVTP